MIKEMGKILGGIMVMVLAIGLLYTLAAVFPTMLSIVVIVFLVYAHRLYKQYRKAVWSKR